MFDTKQILRSFLWVSRYKMIISCKNCDKTIILRKTAALKELIGGNT